MKGFFLLFQLLVFCVADQVSAQQNRSVSGMVTDSAGNAISAATVVVTREKDNGVLVSTVSGSDGSFMVNLSSAPGQFLIRISAVGHSPLTVGPYSLKDGQLSISLGRLTLRQSSDVLQAVAVTAKKPLVEYKMGMTVVNVEAGISAAGSTVLELLEKSPGVIVDKDGNINLNGKSGVQVLIDGKPTYLSNADLHAMLKSMQGDEVRSIELVSSPSAKYDAAGNGGVINIRTKRMKGYGANGMVTLGGGMGQYSKANAGWQLNYRTRALNIFGSYNLQHNESFKELDISRKAESNGTITDFRQANFEKNNNLNHSLRAGVDWSIGKNAVVGFLFNGTLNREDQCVNGTTQMGTSVIVDSLLASSTGSRSNLSNYTYNVNYKQQFDSGLHEINVDVDWGRFTSDEDVNYNNTFSFPDGSLWKPAQLLRSANNTGIEIRSARMDYTFHPKWMKLDAGFKVSNVLSDNTMIFEKKAGEEWQNDPLRTNSFNYDETVWAGYLNGSYNLRKWQYQWGIRVEKTNSEGISPTTNKTVNRSYVDYFPFLQLSYAINKEYRLGFSYSKRIQRPNYQSLNPFIYFLDQYGYRVGNPFLDPQRMHQFEMTLVVKGKYILQGAASFTEDMISEVLLPDTSAKAIYSTYANLNKQQIFRISASAPITVGKWLRSNINANAIYLETRSENLNGKDLNAGRFFLLVNNSNSFHLAKGLTAELNNKFTGKLVYSTVMIAPIYSMDIGLSKTILKDKGTLKFAIADVFNTIRQDVNSVYPGFDYRLVQKLETRVFRINFAYRFGNTNVKASRNRNTGMDTEQGRLKKDLQ
ncbi:TonB-dependent receptor [Flavihumibacter rivuli]|uniref:outer membrane beta-barrel protein n=1 Tax=Flavihumibacter rivuli TaxID=2838156 RepID=UPI001BDE5C49|nr:outer membrane beta-barrel protein [Flavihumibacter rivuli]ULQ55201.1 TonB-dependent receptor [Flavihumibacter rivuli]